ncbi:hypothetical protein [Paenarthrobacter sp. FR1]|uniref:hypothetical protein n=1 Tax=Paenarthrobacter sp. FR1 TaxID=3439548 RepID=UPI003DA2959B
MLLTGCSGASGFTALERPSAASDDLPEGVNFGPETHLAKVLMVAEANGKKYFLGQDEEGRTACLAVYPVDNPAGWHSSCSVGGTGRGEILKTSGPDQKASVLVSDGFDTKDLEASGFTKVHANILVSDG